MRNIDRLAFGLLLGLCAAGRLYAAPPVEDGLTDPPPHCLNIPAHGENLIIDSCSNAGITQEGKPPDKTVPDSQGDAASEIEKGVPDQEGDVAGGDSSSGLENGVQEEGANETTGSRRIMWRQIM